MSEKVVPFDRAVQATTRGRKGGGGSGGGGAMPNDWRQGLQRSATGAFRSNLANACHALREAPELKGAIVLNELSQRTLVRRALPWEDKVERDWTNLDDQALTEWLQLKGVQVTTKIVPEAVDRVAHESRVHPVRELLRSTPWDGVERLGDWCCRYLGAEDTPYTREVGKITLISGAARVMTPGCKVDTCMVLEGPQGRRKSMAVAALALRSEWFADEIAELGSKDAALQTQGLLVMELSEMQAVTGGKIQAVKAFLSRREDRFRPPYRERVIMAPRGLIFIGTTNEGRLPADATGNRRFLPIAVGARIELEALRADALQLWAEAACALEGGEPWWMTDPDIEATAREEQDRRTPQDPWFGKIEEHVRGVIGWTTIESVLGQVIGKVVGQWTQEDENRVARCLQGLGFERRRGPRPQRAWRYVRMEAGDAP